MACLLLVFPRRRGHSITLMASILKMGGYVGVVYFPPSGMPVAKEQRECVRVNKRVVSTLVVDAALE